MVQDTPFNTPSAVPQRVSKCLSKRNPQIAMNAMNAKRCMQRICMHT